MPGDCADTDTSVDVVSSEHTDETDGVPAASGTELQSDQDQTIMTSDIRDDIDDHDPDTRKQVIKKPMPTMPRGRKFQASWMQSYPWLTKTEVNAGESTGTVRQSHM